jgi:phenylacetate-CoA ligase
MPELNTISQAGDTDAGLPRVGIQDIQLEKLRTLVGAILSNNPFYTAKLAAHQVEQALASVDAFRSLIPVTTRQELAQDRVKHPPYGSNLTFPLERYTRCHQTSGTSAAPMRWLDTPESWSSLIDNWVRILDAAGVTRRDRFFFAFSFGPFLGFWTAMEAVQRLGCFSFAGGSMTSAARLQAIFDNRITVLCCTPTYAQHLGTVARERKIDLADSAVRLLVVAGEGGGSIPATRARLEQLWPGATVFDHHGMTEVGPVTYQCPAQPGVLHVLETAYLAEVIDPQSLAAVAPGETGELVLTSLDRIGSPLLRYRTGDLVRPRGEAACACGRPELALEGGILGRSDDMVVVRGVNVYPSFVEEIVRSCPDVTEYRVQLDCRGAMTQLSLEAETVPECVDQPAVRDRLEHSFQSALNLRVLVRLLPPGSLPRFEMKAMRWVKLTE